MQTKNINVEHAPLNNSLQKLLLMIQQQQSTAETHGAIPITTQHASVLYRNDTGASGVQYILQQHQQPQQQHYQNDEFIKNINLEVGGEPPALPPRGRTIIFTPIQSPLNNYNAAEVEGYGPYKPVPPPKPLSTSTPTSSAASGSGTAVCFTPPPYRMPPYPLYNEPSIPGSAAPTNGNLDSTQTANNLVTQGLHTHSNKFPIEREVILSNGDKNSKIPILHDYKKRSKAAIAPDVPPKQLAAWTQANNNIDNQNYPAIQVQGNIQTNGSNDHNMQYRTQQYPTAQDGGGVYVYKEQTSIASTGAVPKSTWHANGGLVRSNDNQIVTNNKTVMQQQQSVNNENNTNNRTNTQTVSVTIETKEQPQQSIKDSGKNTKAMTKTYQTIRGMISSRFKTGKDNDGDKNVENGDTGLNNVTEELRKSNRSIELSREDQQPNNQEERQITSILKKPAGEPGIYGKPRTDNAGGSGLISPQHQFNQQQQMLHTQIMQMQQQYQQNQQFQTQQYQMLPGRSQEQLRVQQDQIYYHQNTNYALNAQQRPVNRYGMQHTPDQSFMVMRHPQYGDIKAHAADFIADDKRQSTEMTPRSQQQLERDNIRQRSFIEQRRTASQPHLASEEQSKTPQTINENKNNIHQLDPQFNRCGSYGNIMETFNARPVHADAEKDSDDGGFIKRNSAIYSSSVRKLEMENEILPQNNAVEHLNVDQIKSNENNPINSSESQIESQVEARGALVGTPKTRLEGEIGKIEGVYNLAQRMDRIELDTTENDEKVIDVTQRKLPINSGICSDYDKGSGQSSSNADSGRGSAAYSSGRRQITDDTSPESSDTHQVQNGNYGHNLGVQSAVRDSEWVDIVENELRHILEPKLHGLSLQGANQTQVANSTLSESISSMTPPLPPLSPGDGSTPNVTPRNSTRYKHGSSLPYGSKPDYGLDSYNKAGKSTVGPSVGGNSSRWQPASSSKHRSTGKKHESSILKGKHLYGLDLADITSTTTRSMDLDSMIDGQSDSDGDISTTDARAIRKQLEGLENMYAEVLKLLGVKKYMGRYQPSDPRFHKRRYGSMSSLPSSSVSSRPIRDKRRAHEERKKVKDLRGINKRFQRLESHVVTLARSVAHLSSEMRTQHLMIQEMENIREEISALRTQTTIAAARAQSIPRGLNTGQKDVPSLANPSRVKKLTKFFGDEPPLLRLFLKSLGYEKYANAFENERVGMVELPYLSEERLQKIGIPLGPRLRILQEAQISVCKDSTLCIV